MKRKAANSEPEPTVAPTSVKKQKKTATSVADETQPAIGEDGLTRCGWGTSIISAYHDEEWGTECHDDRLLFEMLVLGGFQAGLSWNTVLRKRPAFRLAFADFDITKVAKFTPKKLEELMKDEGIIRNKMKLASVVENARAVLKVQKEHESFAKVHFFSPPELHSLFSKLLLHTHPSCAVFVELCWT